MDRNKFLTLLKLPKRLTFEETVAKRKQELFVWLNKRFGRRRSINWENYCLDRHNDYRKTVPNAPKESSFVVYVFVGDYRYSISVTIRESGKNYMGCTSSLTRYRVGEDWTRGGDLPDGEFSEDLLDDICNVILSEQFKELQTRSGKVEMSGQNRTYAADVMEPVDPQVPVVEPAPNQE